MKKLDNLQYCANDLPNDDHSMCCGIFNKYNEIPITEIIILRSNDEKNR